MGYYSGNGVLESGSVTVHVFQHYLWNGHHNVHQRHAATVTRKSGVSLETAQSDGGWCSMTSHQFTIGSSYYNAFNCKGSTRSVRYSRINGSNLFEMQIEDDVITANIDNQSFVS